MNDPIRRSSLNLPTGTVTFLFTDIEGSSRLWEQHSEAMQNAIARHDELLEAAVVTNHGHVVKMRGDGLHAVFDSVQDAVTAAVAGQQALLAEEWDKGIERMPVRMGVYSGSAQLREGDYFGPTVNRAARLQDAGHGCQILLSQVSAGLIGDQLPAGVSLRDLGSHQIKDFPSQERVYQVLAPGLPDHFPPLRTSGGQRTNLPPQTTSFVGRQRELEEAKQLLEQARLVTLTGPGGTGKTRLALQVAREVSGLFRDGAWLIELAALTEEASVLPAIIKVFALQPEPQRSLKTVLVDFMRGKTMLLLLDNCEHLVETCATLARELLNGAADLRILATSREALGVPGEMILRVPSLTLPARDATKATALSQSEAAQLLSERGRAVQQDFQLTDENAASIAEICIRLDGIPLALELAASRLRLFSPQQLASRLNDRFRLLTGGSRTVLPRQQTLRALIDWSYELLSEEEQALFSRLSVFVGGWTYEAAEAISEELDVLDLLDQLVNKSLVLSEPESSGLRFKYLETIRQYAREQLITTGNIEKVRDLHFAYFAHLAASVERDIGGPRSTELRPLLLPEIDNFRQAMTWGIEREFIPAVDLLVGFVSFMAQDTGWAKFIGLVEDVRGWLETAARLQDALPPEEFDKPDQQRARARILVMTAHIAVLSGEYSLMQDKAEKAIVMARAVGDKFTLMGALGFFAIAASTQIIDEQVAVRAAEECLTLARELKKPYYVSLALGVLASYEIRRGNVTGGEAYLAEAAKVGGYVGALSLYQGGRFLAYYANDPAKALPYFQESRRLFMVLENEHFVTSNNSQIAHIQRQAGALDSAEKAYRETLAYFHWSGNLLAVAHELECLAFISQARQLPERAARLFGAAEVIRESSSTTMLPHEQTEYDQALVALKQELNADVLHKAWIAGRAMDLDKAVGYALIESTSEERSPERLRTINDG